MYTTGSYVKKKIKVKVWKCEWYPWKGLAETFPMTQRSLLYDKHQESYDNFYTPKLTHFLVIVLMENNT